MKIKLIFLLCILTVSTAFASVEPLNKKIAWVVDSHVVFMEAEEIPIGGTKVASTSGFSVWIFEQKLVTDKSLPPEIEEAFVHFMRWVNKNPKAKNIKKKLERLNGISF